MRGDKCCFLRGMLTAVGTKQKMGGKGHVACVLRGTLTGRNEDAMTKAEILKKEILRQYRSVRQFAMEMNIPYSTLVTALERGIEGMAYGTVIKMCDKLSLNPVDFSSLERDTSLGALLLENRVMQYYVKLNQTGRDKVLELMDDFVQIEKYRAKGRKSK